ncbi:Ig-like domain-containing protein [Azospirillum sp.]|uniref:Ig-like domain-containing protein n=1 Tax=Azospirillum sp. TaxID=34012 RepID=UPI002D229AC8|nr:Ig-like domain-containing protein [Azospirillum sp.]HYD69490.1 Ig-like domain-containing protein [Azospirillum sp.]
MSVSDAVELSSNLSAFGAPPDALRELIFIDERVADVGFLAAAARPGCAVLRVAAGRDGLSQMAEALAGHGGLAAIHVLSHGEPGSLALGDRPVDTERLLDAAGALRRIGAALADGGDLLVYGCHVAQGDAGAAFLRALAALTGANVAASFGATGGTAAGGTWDLAAHAGRVTAPVFGDPTRLAAYGHTLATISLGGNTGWTAVLQGAKFDIANDPQAGAASLDLVGDANHAVLYTSFDDKGTAATGDDELAFRFRISDGGGTAFGAVALVGIDANLDGKIDAFVSYDGKTGRGVSLWDPGTGANNSPSTTSITSTSYTYTSTAGVNYSFNAVGSTTDPDWATTGSATNFGDSEGDTFVSFKVPFADVASLLATAANGRTSPIYGITKDSALRYVVVTMTQLNSINGDIGGINKSEASSSTPYTQLGAYSPVLTAAALLPTDTTAPTLSGKAPSTGATGIPVNANITLTFSEVVQAGSSGTILIKKVSDNSVVATIQATDTTQLTYSGTQLIINPTSNLATNTAYYVEVASGAVTDSSGNAFAGFTGSSTLSFTTSASATADGTAPTLTLGSSSPTDEATGVALNANITLAFSETVQAGNGTIRLYTAGGTLVESFNPATSTRVTFSGTQVTIDPMADLTASTGHYILIDSGAITDLAGNAYAGISATTTLNFTSGTSAAATAAPTGLDLTTASDTGTQGDRKTKATAPAISGTAVAGATVVLYDGGTTAIGTATANATTGAWTITSGASLADGAHTLTAKATSSGSTSDASTALTVTIDATAPGAPSAPALTGGSDSGTAGDDRTTAGTPAVQGTAEASSTVVLYDGGTTAVGTATADGSGNWTITSSSLSTGGHTLTAKATDAAGNTSTASGSLTLTIDAAPSAPSALGLTTASDTGATSDDKTKLSGPAIEGSAPANSTVVLYDGATAVGTATANGSGAWTVTSTSSLGDGAHTLTAKATDAYGNTSTASAGLTVTVDTTAPTLSSSTPTNGGTNVTTNADVVLTFAEAMRSGGGSVTLKKASDDSTVSAQVTVSGTQVTINPDSNLTAGASYYLLVDGTALTDAAGNAYAGISGTSGFTFTVASAADTTAPSVSTIERTGAAGTLTNAASVSYTVTFSEPVSNVDAADFTVTQTGTATGTVGTVSAVSGSVYTVTVTGVTGAGTLRLDLNASGTGIVDGANLAIGGGYTGGQTYTVDRVAPNAPAVSAISGDTGRSGTDGITSDTTLTITGTAEVNSTVVLYKDGGAIGTVTANGSGNWTLDHGATATLGAGSFTLTAKATDAAGNTSDASSAFAVTIDTTAPNAPATPALATASDTGTASDGHTTAATPAVQGTAEAGSVVVLYDGGTTPLGTVTADGLGNWTITSSSLSTGAHTLTAKATDTAGNTSGASGNFVLTIDTAPSAPSALGLTTASDTGTTGDHKTKLSGPAIEGSAPANSTVVLYEGGTAVGTATANGSGAWTVTSTSSLSDGAHTLTAKATDAYGNTSSASSSYTVTIDATAPNAPAVQGLTTASDTGTAGDNRTKATTPALSGTAEANSVVILYDGGTTAVGTATANGSGQWTITAGASMADGAHTLTATATDAAGNTSGHSSPALTVTIDATAPGNPSAPALTTASDTGTAGDNRTTADTPALSGTAEANSVVVLYDGGTTAVGTATANGSGNWTITSSTLSVGAHTLTAKAADAAGNTSGASGSLTLTIDAGPAAPSALGLTTASDTGTTNDNRTKLSGPAISGSAPANSTVVLYEGATAVGTATANGLGAWTVTATSSLADGAHTLTARATDTTGNVSAASTAFTVTIDATAPTAPGTPDLTAASDTGALSTDDRTRTTAPTLTGTAEAGSTVVLYDGGATAIGTATADGTTGAWTITSGASLADGAHTLTARATDAAGNTSTASAALTVTIDTGAPTVSSTTPADDTTAAAVGANLVLTFAEDVRAGTTTPTATLYRTGGVVVETFDLSAGTGSAGGTATVTGGTVTLNPFADLAYSTGYYVQVSGTALADVAGNAFAGIADATTFNFATSAAPQTSGDNGGGGGGGGGTPTPVVTTPTTPTTTTGLVQLTPTITVQDLPAPTAALPTVPVEVVETTTSTSASGNRVVRTYSRIDGMMVGTEIVFATTGDNTSTTSISAVQPTRVDDPATPNRVLADIPIVRDSGNTPVLLASLPTGAGLSSVGDLDATTGTQTQQALIASIEARTTAPAATATRTEMTSTAGTFLNTLSTTAPVFVRTVTLESVPGVTLNGPIVLNAPAQTGSLYQAVVLDAQSVPAQTNVQINNVNFIAVFGAAWVSGGAGSQTAVGDDAAQVMVLGEDDDTLYGGGGDDFIGSRAGADVLYGDAGNDTVTGGSGADTLWGGVGGDVFYGNQQNDVVYGNQGADTVFGGQDLDVVFGGQDGDLLWGQYGTDVLYGQIGADVLYGNHDDDTLFGGQESDTVFGGQDQDHLYGNMAGDMLYGNRGRDTLYGQFGDDTLFGGQDGDHLLGGEGNDVLYGNLGIDTMEGGAGADVFAYVRFDEMGDTILDFETGLDKLAFYSPSFGHMTTGTLSSAHFALDNPLDADDRFVFNTRTGVLSFDADGSGAGAAVTIATLNVRTLSATDILLLGPSGS